ncbi:hypothetical protein ACI65C_004563 [Semiaphis heraclei]
MSDPPKCRPTQKQMKLLVELMSKNPQLCSGKFSPSFTHKIAREKWENITEHVNSLPGAQKSWDKWKKTWQDTRSSTKSKAAAIKRHISGTGGGPSCAIELNEIQKDALSLMSQTSISGHIQSSESVVAFDFGDDPTEIITIGTNEDELCHESMWITESSSDDINNLKRKANVAFGLGESNKAATRLGDISERKCDMKEKYYERKIKLLEEQTTIFKNINTLLTTLISSFVVGLAIGVSSHWRKGYPESPDNCL